MCIYFHSDDRPPDVPQGIVQTCTRERERERERESCMLSPAVLALAVILNANNLQSAHTTDVVEEG